MPSQNNPLEHQSSDLEVQLKYTCQLQAVSVLQTFQTHCCKIAFPLMGHMSQNRSKAPQYKQTQMLSICIQFGYAKGTEAGLTKSVIRMYVGLHNLKRQAGSQVPALEEVSFAHTGSWCARVASNLQSSQDHRIRGGLCFCQHSKASLIRYRYDCRSCVPVTS